MTRLAAALALCVLVAFGGCFAPRGEREVATPRPHEVWTRLLEDVRALERRIGFQDTRNFRSFAMETKGFPYCGHVSRLYLPYSYEDPGIKWLDLPTQEACFEHGEGADVTFGTSEAIAERGTPVTTSMLAVPLHRFLYLVVHEDCHEQFDLPYGIEEPLCNVIAFRALESFARERFPAISPERRAIERFAREGAAHARVTVASYERLAALYEQHGRAALPTQALLKERARILRTMEKQIAWPKGSMNNVWIANAMTYSRHHALIERVYETLDRDIARTVEFFRRVDRAKPAAAEVVAKQRLEDDRGVEFVRAYEAAVVETILGALARTPEPERAGMNVMSAAGTPSPPR